MRCGCRGELCKEGSLLPEADGAWSLAVVSETGPGARSLGRVGPEKLLPREEPVNPNRVGAKWGAGYYWARRGGRRREDFCNTPQ